MVLYDNNDLYYQPRRRWLRRSPHEEEMRRRVAFEAEMRRRAELKRIQELLEIQQERELEQSRRERRRREEKTFQQQHSPQYELVQDRFGRIYRVPVENEPEYEMVRGQDGRLYKLVPDNTGTEMGDNDYNHASRPALRSKPTLKIRGKKNFSRRPTQPIMTSKAEPLTSPTLSDDEFYDALQAPLRSSSIIVEDASDSECQDEMSMWTNRHPGEGESWIEPIAVRMMR